MGKTKAIKKKIKIPESAIGKIADHFSRDSQTVKRWFKQKDDILTSDPVKEILKEFNIEL